MALLTDLQGFLERGGNILVVIMVVAFFLWYLIVERYWYFWSEHKGVLNGALSVWNGRCDRHSWYAKQIRRQLISSVMIKTEQNLAIIQAIVAIAPLLGLLGTVTGMVEVFDVMAITGSSNARGMAAGVSKATIPTMAGMVVSLSGLFFSAALQRRVKYEARKVSDQLMLGESDEQPSP